MRNISKWKKINQETKSNGHKVYYYKVDGYTVSIQYNGTKYFIIDSNFDLSNVTNYSSKNIQSIFRELNTLFV